MGEPARRIDLIETAPAFTAEDVAAYTARFEGVATADMLRAC
jgi:phosphoadenosine phosphosulfate reductase